MYEDQEDWDSYMDNSVGGSFLDTCVVDNQWFLSFVPILLLGQSRGRNDREECGKNRSWNKLQGRQVVICLCICRR